MPVRFKITFLFSLFVFFILGLVCLSVYFFFNTSRDNSIKRRLTNRAITVGRMLSQREVFSYELIRRIDSTTSFVMQNNVVLAYDEHNNKIYSYYSSPTDQFVVDTTLLNRARKNGRVYYSGAQKDVLAYRYTIDGSYMIIVAAGEDVEGRQEIRRLVYILLLSFFIGLSLAVLFGYFFSKRLLYPINKISNDVKDISALNLSRRIATGHVKDEWFNLSNTLNELLNRLQESFDIQKRFIANASHEISTPLTSILSQIEVSLQREREAKEYKQVLQSVSQDVMHMSKLTQTLLQFAKASGTPGGLEIAIVRIDEVLLRLPSELAKINKGYSINLQFDEMPDEEEKLLVFGNEELLFTALKNIVVNACKYSSDHQATVHLKVEEKGVVVNVIDKGVGIPENELTYIFQPFYRADTHQISHGFGLGLSLAYRIINLHKGKISVVSEVGVGSTFTIYLPASKVYMTEETE